MKFLTSYFVVLFVLKLAKNAIFNVPGSIAMYSKIKDLDIKTLQITKPLKINIPYWTILGRTLNVQT